MARIPILLAVIFSWSVHGTFRNHQNPAVSFLQRVSPFPSASQSLLGRFPGSSFSSPPQSPAAAPADPLAQTCGLAPQVCTESRFRSIDGSCNNLQHAVWGAAHTPYGKLLLPKYADGISALPISTTGQLLPEERQLSLQLFPESFLIDPVWNLNAMQWGQIITHDMSLTAGNPQSRNDTVSTDDTEASNDINSDSKSTGHENDLQCCTNGQLTQAAYTSPQCAPINISPQDPVMGSAGVRCMNFVRTQTTLDRRCTSPREPARPISVVTAFMDLSIIYGSTPTQAAPVRSYAGGRLLTVVRGGQEWPPQDPNVTMTCNMAQSPDEPCYLGGDVRLNQNPQLTVLHIVILREHNRIADTLAQLNPHWDDERTFQEARRINIAINQHINYYEWLPIFLGHENMVKNKLMYPGATGYINDYNPSVNPSILDEHATAAFRFFHTLIRGYLQLVKEDRSVFGSVRISDWFNRPQLLELGNSFSQLVRGLTAQNEDFADQFWTSEVTQFMFKQNAQFGTDLRATDIKRGRDHGLPSYVDTRRVCGLPVPRTFDEMTDYISVENVKVLQSLYQTVDDVELVVAGSLEGLVPGALCGPTYLAILTEQFYRTRVGDRFFYENGHPTVAFTPAQLESIRQASVSRLLCDNTPGVSVMQPQGFRLVGERHNNLLVPCEQLPFVDLSLWQEIPQHSLHYK